VVNGLFQRPASAIRRFVLLWLIAWLPPPAASADWLFTPWVGLKFAGQTNFIDLEQSAGETKLTLGGSGGLLSAGLLGVEADFGYSPRFFERTNDQIVRSNVTTFMGNIVVAAPLRLTRDSLRPYVVGGLGLLHAKIDDAEDFADCDSNLLGLSVGGGAIGPLTDRTSLRFELRHIRNLTEDETCEFEQVGRTRLSFWRVAIGVTLRY